MPITKAEMSAYLQQAEAEADRLRQRLERKASLFEDIGEDDPRRDEIINETCRLLEKYHAADDEAQQWADALERL